MTKRNIVYTLLATLTIAASLSLFYFWHQLLLNPFAIIVGGDRRFLITALYFIASTILFLSLDSLFNLLVKSRNLRIMTYVLVSAGFSGLTALSPAQDLSPNSNSNLVIIALFSGLVLLVTLLYFSHLSQREIAQHTTFSTSHIFGPRINLFITILALILAGQYFLAAKSSLAQFEFKIPDSLLNQAFNLTEQILSKQPGANNLLNQNNTQKESNQNLLGQLPPEFIPLIPLIKEGKLPPKTKKEIERRLPPNLNYTQFKQMVENIPVDENGHIDVHSNSQTFRQEFLFPVKTQIQDKTNQIIQPYRQYLPFVFTALFFLALKSFGFIIDWLAVFFLSIFIGIFKLFGMVEEKTITVEAKRLELKK